METNRNHWMDYVSQAVFSARDSVIEAVSPAAARLQIQPGMELRTLVELEDENALNEGPVYLTVTAAGRQFSATAAKEGEEILFFLDDLQEEDAALRALALAAKELRQPLSDLMLCANFALSKQTPAARQASARLTRGLYQALRLVGNMSDAYGFTLSPNMACRDINALFQEIFEKLTALTQENEVEIHFEGLSAPVYADADRDMLERAVYNLIANSLKFLPKGGKITGKLAKHGSLLTLQIRDSGPGPAKGQKTSLFSRFTREPLLEDSRYGLGLGMVVVRNAARAHGGSVLVDQAPGGGTRVTFSIKIQQSATLRSPGLKIDYAGEMDHSLVELSEFLPPEFYEK